MSTISYNSPEFLTLKLEELRKAKVISLWFWIEHEPEEDEKKAHKHVWILPAKTIQTDDIVEELTEPVPGSKPLKCLHFQSSKFDDWYLYSIHDATYLFQHGQTRKYSYLPEDIVCSDRDELEAMVHEIDMTQYSSMARVVQAIRQGMTFQEFSMRGGVPVQLFKQYQAAWEMLSPHLTYRNGRETHTPAVNPETGEVLDSLDPRLEKAVFDGKIKVKEKENTEEENDIAPFEK